MFKSTNLTVYTAIATCLLLGAALRPVRADNLSTCLDGRYPTLCDKSHLSAEQLQRVARAEHAANLSKCLEGRYPMLCRHGDLTPAEQKRVQQAEHAANLATCLQGRYVALCHHGELDATEALRVKQAEHQANLSTCLAGVYKALCRHQDLTGDEARRVALAEAQHPQPTVARAALRPAGGGGSSGCESGHWIDSVMDDGTYIKLEDGSLWEVDAADTVDSALWLPTTEIVACHGKLINTDDSETVEAQRIR
jgi:hypothetical protein